MIATSVAPVATSALGAGLAGTAWIDLCPILAVLVYFGLLASLFVHPATRAYIICSYDLLRGSWVGRGMYSETNKEAGQWFARTTCIAIIGADGGFEKIYYGKPELLHLMNTEKKNA